MKNILFINHSIRHGGPGKSLFYILKYIDREKIKPYVLIPADDVFSEDLKKEGIYEDIIIDERFPENVMRPRLGFKWGNSRDSSYKFYLSILVNIFDLIALVFTSGSLLKKNKIDLVYCNGTVAKIVGAFIGLINWTPVIWHVRNIQLKLPMIIIMNLLSVLPVIKKIICVSIPTAAQFKYSSDKTVVINNGVDIKDFSSRKVKALLRKEYKVKSDDIIIGTTGRIVPRKKYEIFIDIANKLKAERKDLFNKVKFVIVGNTPYYFRIDQLEVLKKHVDENKLSKKFIFTGYKDDIRPYLRDFDIFVLTSDYPDPFPRSVIEAMSLSKPVVGFSIGGITESVKNNENGYLCSPGDLEEMTKGIIELLD
ncbi:MAG: glycosyltransferase, partial [Candidatus Dadabacteria bacterium]|nr:glycosyltransferase [Candidatus Dadabacteria bacterium]